MSLLLCFCVDLEKKKVQLITTLDNSEVDLLILEYVKVCLISDIYHHVLAFSIHKFHFCFCDTFFFKADKKGPEFKTLHNNTEQLIEVRKMLSRNNSKLY